MSVKKTLRLFVLFSFLYKSNSFRFASWSSKRLAAQQSSKVGSDDFSSQRNRLVTDLLTAAREVGQVGKLASDEDRQRLDDLAQKLRPFSDPRPARISLNGTHSLVYSGSDSGPTAGLVGPFVGEVTQVFWNETVYQNRVKFGPLQVSIYGEKKVVGDETIRVQFYQTQVHLFDKQVIQRRVEPDPGTWDHIFVGQVEFESEDFLLRVLNTPTLFVLSQPMDC